MIEVLFPYKLQLHIFQLESYRSKRFIEWILHHFLTRSTENKKPLIWTAKAKLLYYLSVTLVAVTVLLFFLLFGTKGLIIGLFLATQAYLFILIAFCLLYPFELYQKTMIKRRTEKKLEKLSKVKIIGVTGSYGKTSVKNFIYQILKTKYRCLMTPESYNTPYGIAKVVDLELDNSYDYFVCEMGAYQRGEIKEICDMVRPHYGIVTAINEQHLDTFGSLENTTLGKFELLDAIPDNGLRFANGDNERIKSHLKSYKNSVITYGFSDSIFTVKESKYSEKGTTFTLILDKQAHAAETKLLGKPNVQNILAAATVCYKLGMQPEEIVAAIKGLKPVPHRLEIKELEMMTLIDNAYNSNVDGFKESARLLKQYKQPTVFVTPGIVDLGKKTYDIHKTLGAYLDAIDHVVLIGKSERTKGLADGMQKKEHIIHLDSISELWKKLEEMQLDHPVVLLENDLPDNY